MIDILKAFINNIISILHTSELTGSKIGYNKTVPI